MNEEFRIPIIALRDVLVVSIQGALSDRLVEALKNDLSRRIEAGGSRGLAIDVSGVDLMDSYISRVLRDICLIAKLMGIQSVVCGMRPMIALTLIEMGMELEGVAAELNLELALQHLGLALQSVAPTE
jgi:rsbT antagonist protein RsbS